MTSKLKRNGNRRENDLWLMKTSSGERANEMTAAIYNQQRKWRNGIDGMAAAKKKWQY